MRSHDIPGFVLRTTAVEKYGRSKASFIRDVDRAFERGDTAFLENFMVVLNDGREIPGPEATKEKVQSLRAMQPWFFVKETLLESRYWEKQEETNDGGKERPPKKTKPSDAREAPVPKLSGVSDAVQLEHENILLRQEVESQKRTINKLEESNEFLQEEIESRRGELDDVKQLVDAVRRGIEAGKQDPNLPPSQEQDGAARNEDVVVVDAQAMHEGESGPARKGEPAVESQDRASFWEKHTPTFREYFSRF